MSFKERVRCNDDDESLNKGRQPGDVGDGRDSGGARARDSGGAR